MNSWFNNCKPHQTVIVAIDADNTLWDTNSVFAKAQLHLLRLLENETQRSAKGSKLHFIRSVDQELARLHDYDLRYPPHVLVKATINALFGCSAKESAYMAINDCDVSNTDITRYTTSFMERLKMEVPKLRIGVRRGLAKLSSYNFRLIVVTESNQERCARYLEHHKLGKYIDSIYEVKKTCEAYKNLLFDFPKVEAKVMIGDQLDRDIIPAKAADFFTIYFPGGFKPTWIEQDSKCFDQQIKSFAEVPEIIGRYLGVHHSKS